jgi:hypothetical protein
MSGAGAGAVPGLSASGEIEIIDIGGNAYTNNISILPFGTETISGLVSTAINSNFGAIILAPILQSPGGWTLVQ